jgi:hypothetical protein
MEMSESESASSRIGAVFVDAKVSVGLGAVRAGVDSSELESDVDASELSMII